MSERLCGILLHPTSLPGPGGLGQEARNFIDFLQAASCSIWQMLPPGPVGPENSPYAARSAFALDPMFISLPELAKDGLLGSALDFAPRDGDPHTLDFESLRAHREPLLRMACRSYVAANGTAELDSFSRERPWLMPYARFAALHESYDEPWWLWPASERDGSLEGDSVGPALAEEISYQVFLQWVLERQWKSLRSYANSRGVSLYGDVPIFVDLDSADVWSERGQFKLDARGMPRVVAGVPPDLFSATGQRWGNPHYDWKAMRGDGFAWWLRRMRRTFDLFGGVRIDHFRGFESAWEIPATEETAINGHWEPGPGRALFEAMASTLGELNIIVEDLGLITPEVRALRDALGYPGMAVLQFAFADDSTNPYLPHNHVKNQVVFTGTHDNDTTLGWYEKASAHERHRVRRYLSIDGSDIVNDLIRAAYHSVADTAIIPMQDVLELGSEARMNVPGRAQGNWGWRFTWDQLATGRVEWLDNLAEESGRVRQHNGST
ncbi:MAG: 4-alpha-glucanotransferase [Dehalococcoidia bacterium]